MRFVFTGKNMSVEEGLKERVRRKLGRLRKLLPEDAETQVTFSMNKHLTTMEVSVPMHKRILRAEVTDADVSNCLDAAVDILERQVVKYKSRLRDRRRRNVATHEEMQFIDTTGAEAETPAEANIIRTKRFAFKPMDVQEAVMEMELLNHSFYVFRNSQNDEVNVVYKRKDGEYGLIEPQ
ncbi:MAG: ribosome-associated translation inhibitor RaiA [Defluviitaleaceae bacterium]|nr:ribosome-associated translation inhibitor RaiA [Defluviitaleaceae bacterium]MCL2239989.1 ribosome-associated translation inhibitor RaiA [Defluviitaleaceae bacterium]